MTGSLFAALEAALAAIGARALGVTRSDVLVGYQELELALPWPEVDAQVGDDQATAFAAGVAELVVERAIEARAEELDLATLAPLVLPVLWSRAGALELMARAPDTLAFPFADELVVTLGYAVPAGRRYLLTAEPAGFGVGTAELVQQALANLRRRTPPEAVAVIEGGEDGVQFALDCGDGLDSSRLLLLTELRPELAHHGMLAAAPAREVLSFVPFTHRGLTHLRELANLAHNGVTSLPYPLTDSLFFVAPHQALSLPVSRGAEGQPKLSFPRELVERQARLAASGQW